MLTEILITAAMRVLISMDKYIYVELVDKMFNISPNVIIYILPTPNNNQTKLGSFS